MPTLEQNISWNNNAITSVVSDTITLENGTTNITLVSDVADLGYVSNVNPHAEGKLVAQFLFPMTYTTKQFYCNSLNKISGWVTTNSIVTVSALDQILPVTTYKTETATTDYLIITQTTDETTVSGITWSGTISSFKSKWGAYSDVTDTFVSYSYAGEEHSYYVYYGYVRGPAWGSPTPFPENLPYGLKFSFTESYDTVSYYETYSTDSSSYIAAWFDQIDFTTPIYSTFNQDRRVQYVAGCLKNSDTINSTTSATIEVSHTYRTNSTMDVQIGGDDPYTYALSGTVTYWDAYQEDIGPRAKIDTPIDYAFTSGVFYNFYVATPENARFNGTISTKYYLTPEQPTWAFINKNDEVKLVYDFKMPFSLQNQDLLQVQVANYSNPGIKVFVNGFNYPPGYIGGFTTEALRNYEHVENEFSIKIDGLSMTWSTYNTESQKYSSTSGTIHTSNAASPPENHLNRISSTTNYVFNYASFLCDEDTTVTITYNGVFNISIREYSKTNFWIDRDFVDYSTTSSTSFTCNKGDFFTISPEGYFVATNTDTKVIFIA